MDLKPKASIWIWDTGRWLAATVIEPGDKSARVRFENGVSVAVSIADIALRDPSYYGADRPVPLIRRLVVSGDA